MNKIPIPKICYGRILSRDDKDIKNGLYNVYVYDAPQGPIARTVARLSFSSGTEDNFREGMNVSILISFIWNVDRSKWEDIDGNRVHLILGQYSPPTDMDVESKNPNRDIVGKHINLLNPTSQAGILAEDSGAVRIVTSGKVKTEMSPNGNGTWENMHRTFAQNFHRVISNMDPFYYSREFFGYSIGETTTEKAVNVVDPEGTNVAYKRFVMQHGGKNDRWVSTNEGAFCPWLGNNNEAEIVKKTKEILYCKVINYEQNRISIFGGRPGSGFFTFRIDKIAMAPLAGETFNDDGTLSPPNSDATFYLSISEEGEVLVEAGIDPVKNIPAMQLKVTKDGSVDLQVGKKFTVNGKELVTKDFLDFMQKHQADLVQVSAIGAPAPMSPSAAPDFSAGQKPGNFKTDAQANPMTTAITPFLQST